MYVVCTCATYQHNIEHTIRLRYVCRIKHNVQHVQPDKAVLSWTEQRTAECMRDLRFSHQFVKRAAYSTEWISLWICSVYKRISRLPILFLNRCMHKYVEKRVCIIMYNVLHVRRENVGSMMFIVFSFIIINYTFTQTQRSFDIRFALTRTEQCSVPSTIACVDSHKLSLAHQHTSQTHTQSTKNVCIRYWQSFTTA